MADEDPQADELIDLLDRPDLLKFLRHRIEVIAELLAVGYVASAGFVCRATLDRIAAEIKLEARN